MKKQHGVPARFALAALSGCALLASAAACGRADADRAFTPRGVVEVSPEAGAETREAATPSATVTGTDEAAGPEIQVEWPEGLSPKHKALLEAFVDDYRAQWRAITSHGRDLSYTEGVVDDAKRGAVKWVHSYVDEKLSAKGVIKLYSLRVVAEVEPGAQVAACLNQSGLRVTDWRGKLLAKQPDWIKPPKSTFLYSASFRHEDDGRWIVVRYRFADYPDEYAKECAR
ncbi:hypothetical protein [Sphaerimonospora thailandensis]|uniref:Lipoprotein n=1 Tax=Sphaerimonospora thailandensis TaxID=795644 RepID=A0A8J3R9X5_9ACTN|nr:hypothetical protein [Sphaerimonospora thailandensis]GIH70461.1 hypothetical protein Mth01_27140 [Sphaerimonospora thailandensis]